MPGSNQHHIPQILQRGLGENTIGKSTHIWVYRKDGSAERQSIKATAAGYYFYSTPSEDGSPTLDEEIANYEAVRLRTIINRLRSLATGSEVDPSEAAEVVAHLAPRSSHFREIMHLGMNALINTAATMFSNADIAMKLVGIDGEEPTELFRQKLKETIGTHFANIDTRIPYDVVERIAFTWSKENFSDAFSQFMQFAPVALQQIEMESPGLIRRKHNEALGESMLLTKRKSDIEKFYWKIERKKSGNFILPDCVAVSIDMYGDPSAFIISKSSESKIVLIPLSSSRILIGLRDDKLEFNIDLFNRHGSTCSEQFFLASENSADLVVLTGGIGQSANRILEGAITSTISSLIRNPQDHDVVSAGLLTEHVGLEADNSARGAGRAPAFSFQLTLEGEFTENEVEMIVENIKEISLEVNEVIHLGRLEGITFSNEYLGAIQALDRGFESDHLHSTVNAEIGVGAAQAPLILREGQIKCRIIAKSEVAYALISNDVELVKTAAHILVSQLAEVALTGVVEDALPGFHRSQLDSQLDVFLFPKVWPALNSYFSSRSSAGFSEFSIESGRYKELLISAIEFTRSKIPSAREKYMIDGDIDAIVLIASECVGDILMFSASAIGHADGCGIQINDKSDELGLLLAEMELWNWFNAFAADLRLRFWERRGRWESGKELTSFGRHAERLFWQLGMVPWQIADGQIWIEVSSPVFSRGGG